MDVALKRYAPLILRLGFTCVLVWFAYNELTAPQEWVGWVPEWATNMSGLSAGIIVGINAWVELAGAALLIIGAWTRAVALVLAIHFFVITVDIGLTAIGVRDFGLSMAMLSLAMLGSGPWAFDHSDEGSRIVV